MNKNSKKKWTAQTVDVFSLYNSTLADYSLLCASPPHIPTLLHSHFLS